MYSGTTLHYATIMIGKGQIMISVKEAVSDSAFKYYGNNTFNVIKQSLFPDYYKTKSIPYFKKMRLLIEQILPKIKFDTKSNKELMEKYVKELPDFEQVK